MQVHISNDKTDDMQKNYASMWKRWKKWKFNKNLKELNTIMPFEWYDEVYLREQERAALLLCPLSLSRQMQKDWLVLRNLWDYSTLILMLISYFCLTNFNSFQLSSIFPTWIRFDLVSFKMDTLISRNTVTAK